MVAISVGMGKEKQYQANIVADEIASWGPPRWVLVSTSVFEGAQFGGRSWNRMGYGPLVAFWPVMNG